ncbi:killer cell lectin-like receptor subfamily B member 1 isoform X2 [Pelodiscus sinensis]|uniref:killer cell lectin-like receptor subfamily B member 1 isoform X2 n=1 Tax=Pelodiscus sinensis TaxID=13735 RepID=UPI003F6D50B5
MEDEEGYTALNLRPKRSDMGDSAPAGNPGPRRSPGWPQIALGAGNLLLAVAVLMLALCVFHLVPEKGWTPETPGSGGAGSRDAATPPGNEDPSPAAYSAHLERVRSQLCPPAQPGPAGGAGCKLCPTDWRLRGDKCYWVGTGIKPWDESRSDCAARGSQLLVIRDQEELAALQNLTQASKLMWVGLSLLPPRKAWTWLDGSRLDPTLLPVSGPAEGSSCGAVKGTRLHSDTCSSVFQWICQRDAIPL